MSFGMRREARGRRSDDRHLRRLTMLRQHQVEQLAREAQASARSARWHRPPPVALLLGGGCLAFIVQIAVAVVLPAAIARFAVTSNIGEGLKFGEVFAVVRQNIGMYIVIALMSTFVAGFIAGIGVIACFIAFDCGNAEPACTTTR